MEMNVEISRMIRISSSTFPVQIRIDQKQQENVKNFSY